MSLLRDEDSFVEAISQQVRHYLDLKRREDGFDLSGPNCPRILHPTLKARPMYTYGFGAAYDRAFKHYFAYQETRQALTKFAPTSDRSQSDAIRSKLLDRLKPRADRIVAELSARSAEPVETPRFVPAHSHNYEELVRQSIARSSSGKPLQRGTLPLIRSAPPTKVTHGEYARMLENASALLATTLNTNLTLKVRNPEPPKENSRKNDEVAAARRRRFITADELEERRSRQRDVVVSESEHENEEVHGKRSKHKARREDKKKHRERSNSRSESSSDSETEGKHVDRRSKRHYEKSRNHKKRNRDEDEKQHRERSNSRSESSSDSETEGKHVDRRSKRHYEKSRNHKKRNRDEDEKQQKGHRNSRSVTSSESDAENDQVAKSHKNEETKKRYDGDRKRRSILKKTATSEEVDHDEFVDLRKQSAVLMKPRSTKKQEDFERSEKKSRKEEKNSKSKTLEVEIDDVEVASSKADSIHLNADSHSQSHQSQVVLYDRVEVASKSASVTVSDSRPSRTESKASSSSSSAGSVSISASSVTETDVSRPLTSEERASSAHSSSHVIAKVDENSNSNTAVEIVVASPPAATPVLPKQAPIGNKLEREDTFVVSELSQQEEDDGDKSTIVGKFEDDNTTVNDVADNDESTVNDNDGVADEDASTIVNEADDKDAETASAAELDLDDSEATLQNSLLNGTKDTEGELVQRTDGLASRASSTAVPPAASKTASLAGSTSAVAIEASQLQAVPKDQEEQNSELHTASEEAAEKSPVKVKSSGEDDEDSVDSEGEFGDEAVEKKLIDLSSSSPSSDDEDDTVGKPMNNTDEAPANASQERDGSAASNKSERSLVRMQATNVAQETTKPDDSPKRSDGEQSQGEHKPEETDLEDPNSEYRTASEQASQSAKAKSGGEDAFSAADSEREFNDTPEKKVLGYALSSEPEDF